MRTSVLALLLHHECVTGFCKIHFLSYLDVNGSFFILSSGMQQPTLLFFVDGGEGFIFFVFVLVAVFVDVTKPIRYLQ